uniref:cytochrome c oxidase subunit II n=1 Tax=Anatoecus icterodes TaxID=1195957 RepID=UPI00211EB56E|nr:cytochrome c oxidase subunit II [Anatoecus icterodes]YP_010605969.1 cytochrome c oxidase subunit II [Anatoecus dentatus]UTT72537.1 cytochrome c oxidase subunit 2 [Anatoecus icterodes]WAN81288.1 cytochrome c oxidase subunit II [Anatoecus dentatus]
MNSMLMQDSNSPMMYYISNFHDHVMLIVLMILSLIGYIMSCLMMGSMFNRFFFGNEMLELIWTAVPSMVLGFLALPSLFTLYLSDELIKPLLTIKTIGHQWFWSYEYSDFMNLSFDSYMTPLSEMNMGEYRLLEVDNNLILPMDMEIRMLITSSDVIHSWTVPSLGVKMDAVPGRLNQICFMSNRNGIMYGQCSEICGSFHSFMPICLEFIPEIMFIKWLKSN